MRRTIVGASVVALAAAGPLAACGSDDDEAEATTTTEAASGTASAVAVDDVWARPGTAGGNTAVYMTITGGDTDDALVGVSVSPDVVGVAEVHETQAAESDADGDMADGEMADGEMAHDEMADGDMADGEMADGDMADDEMAHGDDMGGGMMTMQEVDSIDIPAGGTVTFEPGGYHVMLMGLTEDLSAGDTIEVTLEFDSGATETVTAEVREA